MNTQVWTNLRLDPPTRYGPWFYRGVARLKPSVTLEQAQAETNEIGLRSCSRTRTTSAPGCRWFACATRYSRQRSAPRSWFCAAPWDWCC